MTDLPTGLGLLASRMGRDVVDPAEPWEHAVTSAAASRLRADVARPHPPAVDAEIPPGWLRAVRVATGGGVSLDRTMLFPASVRPIDRRRTRFVATPRQLLAFGERGVALAVETRQRPMPIVVAADRIGVLEDVRQLGYVRLTLRAADLRLTVRLDRTTRRGLERCLRGLRRRMAGRVHADVPPMGLVPVGRGEVPRAWRAFAEQIAEEAGELGAAAVFGLAPGEDPGTTTAVLVAVTSTELLVLANGEEADGPYGLEPDLLAFPRRHVQEATVDADRLIVRSAGVERIVRLGPQLAEAAAELVGTAGPVRAAIG